jgi:mannose-1-phosphate guanylyltransferase/mannose-6-phosphate isomerase
MKNSNNLYAVILAGGVGSRFWPLSRQLAPKQFLKVISDKTLLQQTISRIKKLIPRKRIYVITNQHYFYEIKKELLQFMIPEGNIILEPIGKNTAPAIALAARYIFLKDPNSKMVVLPSDHLISKDRLFIEAIGRASDLANNGYLVTLGLRPNRVVTGYGYIKAEKRMSHKSEGYFVDKFIEKPSKDKVKRILKQKNYFWNSGIFIWRTTVILREIEKYLPSLFSKINSVFPGENITNIWNRIDSISIDYGVLEKSKNVMMIPAEFHWSDVGSWESLKDILNKDKNGNILKADSLVIDSKNILIWSRERFVAALGLEDIIVVDTPDALLVCKEGYSEEVRKVVDFLKKTKRQEYLYHKTVNRPWGSYTVFFSAEGFKIKLVEIEPGKRLSLQLHRRRAEHWVVVEGIAKVIYGRRVKYINSNQSIYIPARIRHRLQNPLKNKTLKIVEVQTGKYLEEDDIIRFQDDYQRD